MTLPPGNQAPFTLNFQTAGVDATTTVGLTPTSRGGQPSAASPRTSRRKA